MKKILVIDANSLINRAFYAIRYLSAADSTPTNAIYGFLMTILKIDSDFSPDHIIAAFDLKAPTFRHKMYEDYKKGRKPMPDDLKVQFPIIKDILSKMGILVLEKEGYEADDIIGTVSNECDKRGIKCYIATGDRDDLQLIGDNTTVLLTTTKNQTSETVEYTQKELFDRYGVTSKEFIDVKALMGDASDNIPGVAGIGEKTALSLISKYKNIEYIYENLETLDISASQKNKLRDSKDNAFLSKTLATIDKNVPIDIDFENLPEGICPTPELLEVLENLSLTTIVKKLDLEKIKPQEDIADPLENCEIKNIQSEDELKDLVTKIKTLDEISLWFDISKNELQNIGIAFSQEGYSITFDKKYTLNILKEVFEDESIKKICHSVKDALVLLYPITIKNISYDTEIAAYLINPATGDFSLESLFSKFLKIDPLLKPSKNQISMFDDEEDDSVFSQNVARRVLLLKKLSTVTSEILKQQNQTLLYYNVELPLINVLANMQIEGMCLDKDRLLEFSDMLQKEIETLTLDIYSLAGKEFNINSPKQLGQVLFQDLDLGGKKKTKSGYSTDAKVLEKLSGKHPIIDCILKYRSYAKLKSTYCDSLSALVNPQTKRIHSVFNQTITLTGRISSQEPNMQNIPVRTPLGREMRKMFTSQEGNILIDADYSQIELRVLAHIADDENMKKAFQNDADIHRQTAASILGISPEDVTNEQRSSAKAVNFGIVYGMSDFSLAKDLNISVREARAYIDSYLELYKGVRDYMQNIKEDAKKLGFVKTMMNRIRYIPELKSSNYNVRMFGERVALNTPIQGTAADIIKLAMVKVSNRLQKEVNDAKLILQVHDELIVECKKEDEVLVKQILKEEMENAVSLSVPLVVDIGVGRSWYDCK